MAKKMSSEMLKKHAANKKAFQKFQKKPVAEVSDDGMGMSSAAMPARKKMPMMFPKK